MFSIKKCERCGKTFLPAPQHLYKLYKKNKLCYYCGYNCWRKDGGGRGRTHIY